MSQTNGKIQIELMSSTLLESMRDIIRAEFENHFSKPKEEILSDDGEQLYSRAEAMKILKIGNTTLYNLQKNNAIPFIRYNRKIVFRKSDILNYLNNNIIN